MKNKILVGILGMVLVGCGPVPSDEIRHVESKLYQINFYSYPGSAKSSLIYTIVVIDGNEYFACKQYAGYYSLCPKLPKR